MENFLNSFILYPYPHQFEARLFAILILLAIGIPAFVFYMLITPNMKARVKKIFNSIFYTIYHFSNFWWWRGLISSIRVICLVGIYGK